MAEFEFLKSLVLIFGLSAIVVFLLGKLKISSIIGFLAAGVILGPYGLELIHDVHLVEILAEIGIILLLFAIGLEFSLKNLLALKRILILGGSLQVLITSLSAYMLVRLTGQTLDTSVILGGLIAFSSTAIVLKLLFERAEIDSPHGRICMGILIFQDLCVVLFIMIIPVLGSEQRDLADILIVVGKSFAFIASVIFAARWLVPRILHQIVHLRMRELFVISIIFICLGAAFLTYKLGFSLALGAFIAGLVISESEYSYQAISDILPFKDSFNGLFFIAVGMLMNVHFFFAHIGSVLLIVACLVALKLTAGSLAVFLTTKNMTTALRSGLILAQIGEFSFVLAVSALKLNLLTEETYQLFLSSAIITMLLTPLLVAKSHKFSTWMMSRSVLARLPSGVSRDERPFGEERRSDHVIIIGFGLNGRNLAIVLKELEVPYAILELNSRTVTRMSKQGEPIYYGDGTSRNILEKLGITRARAIAISITDPSAVRKIVALAREMNPQIYIVVRTRYLAEVDDLLSLGADHVIPAEFETSIEIFSRILQFYHMPTSLIHQYAERFRKNHYTMFVKGETPKRLFHDTVAPMPDMDYESFVVEKGSPAVNASIENLDIQNRTGAQIIAIKRGDTTRKLVSQDFILHAGDIIFLIGQKTSLDKANSLFFIRSARGEKQN